MMQHSLKSVPLAGAPPQPFYPLLAKTLAGDSEMQAIVFLAEGFEEIEATTIIDVLRRCNITVAAVGFKNPFVKGGHNLHISVDMMIPEVNVHDVDAVICPGGGVGTDNLRKHPKVLDIIRKAHQANKLVAAICAAPAVLADAGVLHDRRCTIYPGMEDELTQGGGIPSDEVVVVDGNIITSRGPATALPFALRVAEYMAGKKVADDVARRMLAPLVLK
jgi:4-methyl-5(b-hydroxyethyl)-thiazole monophosphate biosynthesis